MPDDTAGSSGMTTTAIAASAVAALNVVIEPETPLEARAGDAADASSTPETAEAGQGRRRRA